MGRPLRIQAAGLSYHVTARGNGRMAIYRDDRDRRRFLRLLTRVTEVRSLACHAYCLMPNHYHLVTTTCEPNLSQVIKELNGPYAQWWNRRHGHVGHVFQGRFHAQVVQDDAYLLTVCRYVVLNPVRAGLVDKAEHWPWSSYRATAGMVAPPPFLQPEELWRRFNGGNPAVGIRRYREFVAAHSAETAELPAGPVLGDTTFMDGFKEWRDRASSEVARREREARPPLEELFAGAVTKTARNQQAVKAYELGHPMVAIARYLDLHHSTVSKVLAESGRRAGARS